MAIATYSDLQTSITNWLKRADLTSLIPDWISLCEADYNRRLRISAMEDRATSSVSSEYVALPTGFLELRSLQLNTSPVTPLTAVGPEYMDLAFGGKLGKPLYYAIVGDEIQLSPAPDGTYTLEINYYATISALSASNTTNWVLTNAPDIYLYGSLLHSAPYIRNDQRLTVWNSLYEKALKRTQDDSDKRKWSVGSLEMRVV